MIIKELRIADDTAETYQEEATARHLELGAVLVERLEHAQTLDPRQRYLIVEGKSREQLEALLGGLPLVSVRDLTEKVRRLARIKFGDHVIELSPGQMEEMAWRAKKQGKTVAELIRLTYEKFAQDFFTMIPGTK